MEAIFAGFTAGYFMAIVFTWLGAVMLTHARAHSGFLSQGVAGNLSWVALAVPISILSFLGWTAVGMILGLLYRGAETEFPDSGLGSPNFLFTLVIVLFAGLNLIMVQIPLRRLYWPVIVLAFSFLISFGWIMPHIAEAAS
jgi:hypothetical protein